MQSSPHGACNRPLWNTADLRSLGVVRVTSDNVLAADIATADSDTDVPKVPCAKARAPAAVITAKQSNEGSKIRRPLTAKAHPTA